MHFPSKATDLIWPVVSEIRNCTSPPRGLHEWACRRSDNPRPIVSMHHPRPSTSSRLSARNMTGGGVRRSGGAALAAVAATSDIAAADANSCKRCMCPSITFMISVLNLYAFGRIVRRKTPFWQVPSLSGADSASWVAASAITGIPTGSRFPGEFKPSTPVE